MFGAVPAAVPVYAASRQRPFPGHHRSGIAVLAAALAAAVATSCWPSSVFAALATPTSGRNGAAEAEAYGAPSLRDAPAVDDVEQWFEDDANEFYVGQGVQGKVKHVLDSGTALVNVGAKRPAMLGGADTPEGFALQSGKKYRFIVKDVKPDGTIFLSFKRSSRDLKLGWEFDGVVDGFARSGSAYIDIGFDRRGLLMPSAISEEWVPSAADVLREGQQVHVWVKDVRESGDFLLSMVRVRKSLDRLRVGHAYTGTIKKLATIQGRDGAFVDIGATRDGWLPMREFTRGMDLVPGRDIDVFVTDVRSRDFFLSMQKPKTPLHRFRVGEKLRGRVAGYTDFGTLWVDVGGIMNGIVPADGFKSDGNLTANEAYNINQIISVWVKKKRDSLVVTMIRPRLDVRSLRRGDAISARIANLDPHGGVFVEIGAVSQAYLPPRGVSESLKAQPLEVDQELDVRFDNLNRHGQAFVSTLPYDPSTKDFLEG